LARTLHSTLEELGEVTYFDAFHDDIATIKGQYFDIFVGVAPRFEQIAKRISVKHKILFAVNMHPSERNKMLRSFKESASLPAEAVSSWEYADEKVAPRILGYADDIICVGNVAVINSYFKHGVKKNRIKPVNYSVGEATTKPSTVSGPKKFLYVASEIGLRKGFDVVYDIFAAKAVQKEDFVLTIVGLPSTDYYEKKIKKLQSLLGKKVVYKGWIDSATKEYEKLLEAQTYVVFPSLEEGQAGSVLDAMRRGVVPVISANSGIDFSPLGLLSPELKSTVNKTIIQQALALDKEIVIDLKQKTLNYYQAFHGSNDNLKQTVKDSIAGSLYPKISIVLPIFNKEKQIIPLLRDLDRACRKYGNCEAKVIFDGCKDNTEKLVRAYYKNRKAYPVEFFITPNIFEVKTNNLGMKAASGKYCFVLQDDNFVLNDDTFIEAVAFLEKNPSIAILGCLAGVNYYPLNSSKLQGQGQIAQSKFEVYWRQDAVTDPTLNQKFFEVDACMRGPLIFRKDYLEKYGYLDETYAPLYQDDMDIAFRARKDGYHVYCGLFDVENRAFTMAHYDAERNKFFDDIIKRNTRIFYDRWKPTSTKNYPWLHRNQFYKSAAEKRSDNVYKLKIASLYNTGQIPGKIKRTIGRKVKHTINSRG
jgi:GT2 family glycosyltransferase